MNACAHYICIHTYIYIFMHIHTSVHMLQRSCATAQNRPHNPRSWSLGSRGYFVRDGRQVSPAARAPTGGNFRLAELRALSARFHIFITIIIIVTITIVIITIFLFLLLLILLVFLLLCQYLICFSILASHMLVCFNISQHDFV